MARRTAGGGLQRLFRELHLTAGRACATCPHARSHDDHDWFRSPLTTRCWRTDTWPASHSVYGNQRPNAIAALQLALGIDANARRRGPSADTSFVATSTARVAMLTYSNPIAARHHAAHDIAMRSD